MNRALPLLGMLAACSLRDPRVTVASCTSASQCSRSDVCFLGECRAPSSNLSVVRVQVRPPSTSLFGLKQTQLDLRESVLNDFKLDAALSIGTAPGSTPGTVLLAQDGAPPVPVAGATITFSDHSPLIPDRIEQVASVTDATGNYGARLPRGSWDVHVVPPGLLPPIRYSPIDTSSGLTNFILPATSTLAQLTGTLSADAGPVAGASVTAVDAQGTAVSASAISQPDGGYAMYLAPSSSQPLLQIGPRSDADAGVASALPDPFPTYPGIAYAQSVDLQLTALGTLSGRMVDSTGAPIAGARVAVRSTNMGWVLSRSAMTDSNGAYSVVVRQGTYLAQAIPSADPNAPALSGVQSVAVQSAAVSLDFACPLKVRRFGQVLGPDGRAVGINFQIVATRLSDELVTTRSAYTVPTDSNGLYHLIADAGRWRLEVVPPATSPLPRKIVQVDLDGSQPAEAALPAVQISAPLEAVGTVRGSSPPPDLPVADAVVSFYALDSNGGSVFLGSSRTDAQGRYTAIVPDVAQPGIGP